MNRLLRAWALVLPAFAVVPAHAQQEATPVNGDTRLVTFDYDPDQTYLILTRPKAVTHIQLRPDEKVKGAFAGDTANFTVVVSADRNNILIRPKYPDLSTSFTLLTTERNYPMMLRSTPEATGKWYQRVTWNFPDLVVQDMAMAQEREPEKPVPVLLREAPPVATSPRTVALDRVAFNYSIQGDAEFRPLQVFDDGRRTFLRFAEGLQAFPALFALEEGDLRVLNFSVEDPFVVVQGVVDALLLKLGKSEVRVTRGAPRRGLPAVTENYGG